MIDDALDRLGLNVPREVWPTTRALDAIADAGFGWVQFHAPPAHVLADAPAMRRHARGLAALRAGSGLRLVLHAPDDLSAGLPATDAAFAGLIDHAVEAGAEIVAYHGLNFPAGSDGVRERASLEERSLMHLLQRAHTHQVTVAIENLAPVFDGPPRLSHDPIAVRDLVRRLDTPAAGMLLDLGHLHVTSDAANADAPALAAACAPDVVLFHVHDNLGARRRDVDAPGVDPLRLDLHLAPGAGTTPWPRIATVAGPHRAPLMLEVQPQHRPALPQLCCVAQALLTPAGAAHRRAA